jgi:hypothetical protein
VIGFCCRLNINNPTSVPNHHEYFQYTVLLENNIFLEYSGDVRRMMGGANYEWNEWIFAEFSVVKFEF